MSLFFYDGSQIELAIIGSMMASIGFSGSLVFYDAFMPEIATVDMHDKISARGYSFGYVGSVLLLVLNLVMISKHDLFGIESEQMAMRISFLMVGLWWISFSQIPFKRLPQQERKNAGSGNYLVSGYKELGKVLNQVAKLRDMRIYLVSYFFSNTGVQTVILLASTFASKVIGMEGASLIIVILIIQLVAILGAHLFARVSGKIGNKNALLILLVIWIGICFAAYLTHSQNQFYIVAVVVGLVMGGIQSLSRATFSKLIPTDSPDHASFFSFYDVTYYISVVLGTFSYGFVEQLTNDMRLNTLVMASFFIIGFVFLLFLRFDFKKQGEAQ